MRPTQYSPAPQRGAAAVELALVMMYLSFALLAWPLPLAQYFLVYSASQKAAQDAARFISTAPQVDMRSTVIADEVSAIARQIAANGLADLPIDSPRIDVLCYDGDGLPGTCGNVQLPESVFVQIRFQYQPKGLLVWNPGDTGGRFAVYSRMRYVGQ